MLILTRTTGQTFTLEHPQEGICTIKFHGTKDEKESVQMGFIAAKHIKVYRKELAVFRKQQNDGEHLMLRRKLGQTVVIEFGDDPNRSEISILRIHTCNRVQFKICSPAHVKIRRQNLAKPTD
jgi:sRNA-binding carbon storage regulator CsrA